LVRKGKHRCIEGVSVNLKARVARLEKYTANLPEPGQIDFVACYKVGSTPAENRPVGVYPSVDGGAVEVVFSGEKPDPELVAELRSRMPEWGLMIVSHADN
jgi:hypothetical protein